MLTLCKKTLFNPQVYYCVALIRKLPKRHYYDSKVEPFENDAIDEFTTQLVQRRAQKWVAFTKRKAISGKHILLHKVPEVNIENLNVQDIDSLFINALDDDDELTLKKVLEQSIALRKLPSLNVLLRLLTSLAQKGDVTAIESIRDIYRIVDSSVFKENSEFTHFLAEAVWINGNIIEAINLIEDVYRKNIYLRRRIRIMLKYLIHDGVLNQSEAVLHNVIKFCERISVEFRDHYPLVLVWENCILSDWFSDQCIAVELLKKHEKLCEIVTNLLSFVVMSALHKNNTDVVYRLLELFLQKNRNMQTLRILVTLFDYKVCQRDFRGCSEIIKWCQENNFILPSVQQEKFINLLLKYGIKAHSTENTTKQMLNSLPILKF